MRLSHGRRGGNALVVGGLVGALGLLLYPIAIQPLISPEVAKHYRELFATSIVST